MLYPEMEYHEFDMLHDLHSLTPDPALKLVDAVESSAENDSPAKLN